MWDTSIEQNVTGKEVRIAYETYPRYQWDVIYSLLRSDSTNHELQTLLGFYNSRNARFDSFLYTDSDDYSVTLQPIGIGDGSTRTFQLVSTFGGFTQPVLAPNTVSAVYVDGVNQVGFWSVSNWGSTTPGVLTFSSGHAPANGKAITATFTYYFPVRFVDDKLSFNNFMNQLWECKKLSFISIK
jgi:uncharacterized protein (TIGR02217 family)